MPDVPFLPPHCESRSETADRWVGLAQRLAVCARALRELLARCAQQGGLSEPQFTLLWACRRFDAAHHGVAQSRLAERLAVSPAQVSGLVEELRRAGYLEGRRDPQDRRRQLWRPTSKGLQAVRSCLDELTGWAECLEDRLRPDAREAALKLLDELMASLRQQSSPNRPRAAATGGRRSPAAEGRPAGSRPSRNRREAA